MSKLILLIPTLIYKFIKSNNQLHSNDTNLFNIKNASIYHSCTKKSI